MSGLRPRLESGLVRLVLGLPPRLQRLILRRPLEADGQTLVPELQLMLRLQRLTHEPAVEDLPVEGGRAALARQAGLVSGAYSGRQPIGAIRELSVDGAEGPLPARLYVPSSRLGADRVPTLLFLHGGGWVYGDLDSHDGAVRHLAEQAGVQVLAVDYRLAPENPFPAGADDALAAYRWLVAHTDEVDADPERLAVGGDSAGANLAAGVALVAARERLPLRFQLLVYPATDFTRRTPSRDAFGEGLYLTDRFVDQCTDWYLPDESMRTDPRASVLLAEVPAGTAPALVVTAAMDPLRDEGEEYAARLLAAGVRVEQVRLPGMMHGFFNIVSAGRVAPAYNREIAQRLREALA
jgi:acetyl esterase